MAWGLALLCSAYAAAAPVDDRLAGWDDLSAPADTAAKEAPRKAAAPEATAPAPAAPAIVPPPAAPAEVPSAAPAAAPRLGPSAEGDGAIGSFGDDTAAPAPAAVPSKPASVAAAPSSPDRDSIPKLTLLPMALRPGGDSGARAKAAAGLRLGLAESGRFVLGSEEAAARDWPGGRLPPDCFDARCVSRAAASAPTRLVLASDFSTRDGRWVLRLVLAQSPDGGIRRALQVWAKPVPEGPIAFAREAALRLADPGRTGPGVDGAFFASGEWRKIPWLNPRDSVDNHARWTWAGAGVLAGAAALAYAQGQLTGADDNASAPARALRSGDGAPSFLRGFFATPPVGARYAAMGGAGVASVEGGISLLMNPAGVARSGGEDVVAAKRNLPDGAPSFFLAYAGPAYRSWHQGMGIRFEGDGLSNETSFFGTLAADLEMLGPAWAGVKVGAQAKIYLAQVGEDGTGFDRSTGHSFGLGLDLGVQAPLGDRITAALSVRDAAGFLRHTNTFTDRSYSEILPAEYKIGAAYRAANSLTLLLDGQKGVWADQADHLRVGGEQVLWDFLALRGGLHEAFGREAVRSIAVGFGLNSAGLKDKSMRMRISLDYAYEFGMDAEAPLAGGQQFTLEAGF